MGYGLFPTPLCMCLFPRRTTLLANVSLLSLADGLTIKQWSSIFPSKAKTAPETELAVAGHSLLDPADFSWWHTWFGFLSPRVQEQTFRSKIYIAEDLVVFLVLHQLKKFIYVHKIKFKVKLLRSCNSSHHISQNHRYFSTTTLFYWALHLLNL